MIAMQRVDEVVSRVRFGAFRAPRRAAAIARRMMFAAVAAAASAAHAQGSAETHAAILLTLPSSARGLALGDAWGAVADDESALFYNPAQLARVRGFSVGGSLQ